MKRLVRMFLVLSLVAITLVVGAGSVMAAGPSLTEIKGTISAIDAAAAPPTVTITPKEGAAVVLNVVETTVITKAGLGKTTLDKLAVGDRATATYDAETLAAGKISASKPLKDYSSFVGTIKSLAADSLVVTTKKNGDVTITVNADTRYKVPGLKEAGLGAFQVGDKVAVLSVAADGGNLALHIVLVPGKPVFAARVGTVEAYVASTSITVKGIKGDTSTFVVNSDTRVKMAKGVSAVEPGQRVIVSARRDPATDTYTATSIHVFAAKKGK